MVRLYHQENGSWRARKRLPDDVREDYGDLYGQYREVLFYAPATTKPDKAEQLFNEWSADVKSKIAAIRAQHKGEGISLTPRQARGLAGEWYHWFIERHPLPDVEKWEGIRDRIADALKEAAGDEAWEGYPEQRDELWDTDEELRKAVRPVLADLGETAQFLHQKGIVLDSEAQTRFLDYLYHDLAAALRQLFQQSRGDYSPDTYPHRFPKFKGTDTGETPRQLFDAWVREKQPATSTIESWRTVFRAMAKHFEGRSAGSISDDEAQQWIRSLVTKQRQAATVRKTWITASRTIFGWAVEHKRVPHNAFAKVKVTVPRRITKRETKAFRSDEWQTILKASLAVSDTSKPFQAAKRWVPWLLAYTGARPTEITQLRKQDVTTRDGIHALFITPEAGSVKTRKARIVPLHEHLVEQGFLKFVKAHREGPLFFKPRQKHKSDNPLDVKKSPAAQVRQRLTNWVRSLGVDDGEVSPNHAWRHTFKQRAERAKISERMSDAITGHAPRSVGASYGAPTLEDMAEAMKEFPRYEWGDQINLNRRTKWKPTINSLMP